MSDHLDRAARELWRLTPLPEHDFRAALRAYQDLREWTVEELEALHTEALLVDRDNRPIPALPAQWWMRDGADLGPLRLVYNPDDLKEN